MNTQVCIEWLEACAKYFENKETYGDDMAHWSNVINAQNARKIRAKLQAGDEMAKALEHCLRALNAYKDDNFTSERKALTAWRKTDE